MQCYSTNADSTARRTVQCDMAQDGTRRGPPTSLLLDARFAGTSALQRPENMRVALSGLLASSRAQKRALDSLTRAQTASLMEPVSTFGAIVSAAARGSGNGVRTTALDLVPAAHHHHRLGSPAVH